MKYFSKNSHFDRFTNLIGNAIIPLMRWYDNYLLRTSGKQTLLKSKWEFKLISLGNWNTVYSNIDNEFIIIMIKMSHFLNYCVSCVTLINYFYIVEIIWKHDTAKYFESLNIYIIYVKLINLSY